MALYTLPNGSTYNTSLPFNQQPDTGSYEFMDEVEIGNTPIKISIPGVNPNIPRVKTQTWTALRHTRVVLQHTRDGL